MGDISGLEGLIANDLLDYFEPGGKFDNLVFLDVETTGFSCMQDRIIELAAIRVTSAGIQRQEDLYIRLPDGGCVPAKITGLTDITDEKLRLDGVSEEKAAGVLFEMIEGSTCIIAYNAEFDLSFIGMMFYRQMDAGHPEWMKQFGLCDYLDPMTIYKDRRAKPHKLKNAIKTYHLEDKVENSHRAMDDVKALFEVTKAMGRERDDLVEYKNIFGINPGLGLGGGRKFKKVKYIKQKNKDYMCQPGQALYSVAKGEQNED